MAYSDFHLYMDDVEIGQSWVSPGRTLTETDIVNFAGLSGDYNPIHMNHEFAASTPFGRPIAHGLLGMAITSGLALYSPPMRTMAFVGIREWQFLEPLYMGDTVTVRTTLVEKEVRGRGRRGLLTWQRELLKQDDKIAQKGITLTLVEGRSQREAEPRE